MPDWSYRTVFRPILFRLPAAAARGLCLGAMGTLARLPLGPRVIDFLGHMRADARLRRTVLGLPFPSPVGLGPYLDVQALALPALARFGVGFLDVGPITAEPVRAAVEVERLDDRQAFGFPEPFPNPGANELARRLERAGPLGAPLVVRLGVVPGATADEATVACRQTAERLAPVADLFALATAGQAGAGGWPDEAWSAHVAAVAAAVAPKPLLLCLPADLDPAKAERLLGLARGLGVAGTIVDGRVRSAAGTVAGAPVRESAARLVRHVRPVAGPECPIIASGGIHEPADALALLEAGADLVEVDTGLVFGGPGLPKRVNEAILATTAAASPPAAERAVEMSWFWTTLLGTAMLLGGGLALTIAATRVVLPYDEAFVGLHRDQFATINPRLLAFMTHDRVTLAGTMLAIGVFYVGLSLYGLRRGLHWARVTVLSSAFAGFGSFFLFLGFGYFDPFHAFVTAVLFQFLLLGVLGKLGAPAPPRPDQREDRAWRLSQWGQLLFVAHGVALLTAGVVIAVIGSTSVFVPEDLEFMQTTAAALRAANPRLVPVVAHDRASFGGMLVASGLVVLLSALWGWRRGEGWLWWTYLLGGGVAYAAAVGVHLAVGYTHLGHLAPAFAGALLLAAGLGLARPYLCERGPADRLGGSMMLR
jgi:dihydroorotate dehydrogenase